MTNNDLFESKDRIESIDALRGFTMFWIIGGDKIMRTLPNIDDNIIFRFFDQQFRHVEWEGFHFYDLIFPMFLFVIGVVQPFSINKRTKDISKKHYLYKHISKRFLLMFLLGLIYYGIKDPHLKSLGYYGVLQLLAVGYLFSSLIVINSSIRGVVLWTCGILLGYFLLLKFIPVPGFGPGVFTKDGNFSNYIGTIASENLSPKFRKILTPYILSPIATALLGVLAGYWLKSDRDTSIKFKGLIFGGLIIITIGLIWANWYPIIKNLWTGSYVLLTAGISSILLGLFYWLIDIKGYSKWFFFFIVIGLNPITIYILERIIDFRAIAVFFTFKLSPYFGKFEPFVLAICIAFLHWLVVYWLYKKRIFIKI